METRSQFFLHCPLFTCERQILLHRNKNINMAVLNKTDNCLVYVLLYGDISSHLDKIPAYLAHLLITYGLHQKKSLDTSFNDWYLVYTREAVLLFFCQIYEFVLSAYCHFMFNVWIFKISFIAEKEKRKKMYP